jgi:hypothetical protein
MAGPAAAQGNPYLQTVKRSLPQTTEAAPNQSAPFIRLVKKMETFGALWTSTAGATGAQTPSIQIPAAPGFLRAFTLYVESAASTGSAAIYAQNAPYSLINNIQIRDINNTVIFNLSGYELYLVNLLSGQCSDNGTQNPAALATYKAPANTGVFSFRLLVPFELNRSGYCSLAAASQATPIQFILSTNALTASGLVYSTAPTTQTSQTITVTISQLFWGLNQGSVEQVHPDDLGASTQWTSAGGNQSPGASSNTSVIAPTLSGWLTTLICTLYDSGSSPAPARVTALPPKDATLAIDGVPLYNRVRIESLLDKLTRNFGVFINGNVQDTLQATVLSQAAATASPGPTLTQGVVAFSWRDSVAESVLAADTLDELIHVAPGTRLEFGGTFGATASNGFNGAGATAPYNISFLSGILVPTDQYGLPYTHLTY